MCNLQGRQNTNELRAPCGATNEKAKKTFFSGSNKIEVTRRQKRRANKKGKTKHENG
jgi:hypothetical protein